MAHKSGLVGETAALGRVRVVAHDFLFTYEIVSANAWDLLGLVHDILEVVWDLPLRHEEFTALSHGRSRLVVTRPRYLLLAFLDHGDGVALLHILRNRKVDRSLRVRVETVVRVIVALNSKVIVDLLAGIYHVLDRDLVGPLNLYALRQIINFLKSVGPDLL